MQVLNKCHLRLVYAMLIFCFIGCETYGPPKDQATLQQSILTEPVPEVSGPKRTVAVGKFDAIGAFMSEYGDWDIGGGLAAMLITALIETDKFIVLERANIEQVLSEQELKASGVANPETGPALGKLIGAQFMIYGSVTEFGAENEGSGFSIGGAGGGFTSLFSGALSRKSASGSVAMDIRIVDTTTGRVVETHRVQESIKSSGWDVSGGYQGVNLGTNQFNKTPLGEATRKAIKKAVHFIALYAQKTSWTGRVVYVDGNELYINAGLKSGVRVGDKFMIEGVAKKFTDPETAQVLGVRKKELGTIQINEVEENMAYGAYIPLDQEPPKRGDIVVKIEK